MNKKIKLGIMALLLVSSTYADDSFSWNLYMRAGTGINLDSSEQETASTNSTGTESKNVTALGRFGNEYDTWITSTLTKKITAQNGSWAEIKLAESYSSSDPEASSNFYLDEASVKMGGLDFLPNGATIKAGKFGLSEDIHALDYKFKSVGGTGISYQKDKMKLTFMINEDNTISNTAAGKIITGEYKSQTKAIDFENSYGNFDAKLTLSQRLTSSDSSVSGLIAYNQKKLLGIAPGTTKYIAEIGKGVGMRQDGVVLLSRNMVTNKDDMAWRFVIDGHSDLGKWIINPVVWAESVDFDNKTNLETHTSITAGGRLTQKLTNNLEMVYEGFMNNTQNKLGVENADGTQYKISAGPVIQLQMGEWVRPAIRLSATYIGGEKKITGLTEDSELRAGMQFETWF